MTFGEAVFERRLRREQIDDANILGCSFDNSSMPLHRLDASRRDSRQQRPAASLGLVTGAILPVPFRIEPMERRVRQSLPLARLDDASPLRPQTSFRYPLKAFRFVVQKMLMQLHGLADSREVTRSACHSEFPLAFRLYRETS